MSDQQTAANCGKRKPSPEYWWAEEIQSGKVMPVEVIREQSDGVNDSVVMIGDEGKWDVKFYRLIEQLHPPGRKAVADER
jgi:hypothetical protein